MLAAYTPLSIAQQSFAYAHGVSAPVDPRWPSFLRLEKFVVK